MQTVLNFKNSAPGLDLTTPVCRYFVMCEIGLAKIYSCTKFDVSNFTHSRFMEEDLKFKIWARTLTTPLLRVFSQMRWDLSRSRPLSIY